ncbi:hypothetical protein, partial [Corallococcus sp. AB038B]|uniref:hypothetical protein n=1 Tax=Corallococcus sp. AB038B TaxID=2316718 RepID=UPI000EE255EE
QGKAIINSVNLEDGEERFEKVVPLAKAFGAALVVGCIDEVGMVGLGAGDATGVWGDSVQARQAARRQADSRGARFMSPGLVHHAEGADGARAASVQEPSGGADSHGMSGLRACVVWGLRLLLRHRKAVLRD